MKWIVPAAVLATMLFSAPVQAEECGWYAIAYCAKSKSSADRFANKGWGQVIETSYYNGFQPGYFCVVSGPQSKGSASRDVKRAKANGVSRSAYIKRACTDDNGGD